MFAPDTPTEFKRIALEALKALDGDEPSDPDLLIALNEITALLEILFEARNELTTAEVLARMSAPHRLVARALLMMVQEFMETHNE